MRNCVNCGKEVQDDMQFCPSCGTQVSAKENDSNAKISQPNESSDVNEENSKRKMWLIIVLLIVIAISWFAFSSIKEYNTQSNFQELYTVMGEGLIKTEEANLLIIKVWGNSIRKESDSETDKYTKKNGKFYKDFDDALKCLAKDPDFSDNVVEIYELQEKATGLMKKLANHPKEYEEQYYVTKELYDIFIRFTNMPILCQGSLIEFYDEHNSLEEELMYKLMELKMYLP